MPGKKILLVDDAETILMMEKMILGRNYVLVVARDGEEAVSKARTEKPDLILMDVVMPRMNGFEACRHVRHNEETRAIPIIMVTTRGESMNIEEGYASGCNDYVTKPINGMELLTKIRNLVGE